jgi:hypothetical protein
MRILTTEREHLVSVAFISKPLAVRRAAVQPIPIAVGFDHFGQPSLILVPAIAIFEFYLFISRPMHANGMGVGTLLTPSVVYLPCLSDKGLGHWHDPYSSLLISPFFLGNFITVLSD